MQKLADSPELAALLKELQVKMGLQDKIIVFGMIDHNPAFCTTLHFFLDDSIKKDAFVIAFDERFIRLTPGHQKAVLAHELGHISLGHLDKKYCAEDDYDGEKYRTREWEADMLAIGQVGETVYWEALLASAGGITTAIRMVTAESKK